MNCLFHSLVLVLNNCIQCYICLLLLQIIKTVCEAKRDNGKTEKKKKNQQSTEAWHRDEHCWNSASDLLESLLDRVASTQSAGINNTLHVWNSSFSFILILYDSFS